MLFETIKLLLFTDRIDIDVFYKRCKNDFLTTVYEYPIYIVDAFSYLLNFKNNEFSKHIAYVIFKSNKINILFDLDGIWFNVFVLNNQLVYESITNVDAANMLKRNTTFFGWYDDDKIIKIYGFDKDNYRKYFIYLINESKKRLKLMHYLTYKHLEMVTTEPTEYLNSLYYLAFI